MPRRHYGWAGHVEAEARHDERDLIYAASRHAESPALVDLKSLWKRDVYNQGPLGSCGPNSAASDILAAYPAGTPDPSRLFMYYTTRVLMGTTNQDSGVVNRTLFQALHTFGFCDESLWPYVVGDFAKKPSDGAYQQASERKIDLYLRVPQDLEQMKGCLAGGDPFVFGFTVFPGFESAETTRTGIVPMPGRMERSVGGHDVVICGFDVARALFMFRNSWGPEWGDGGYGYIPFDYALNPKWAGDFWTARYKTAPTPPPPPAPVTPRWSVTEQSEKRIVIAQAA